ncbi:MAG: glycosyltransferase family 2 protein [Candidatus Sericytochromatia bacterium]
MLSIIVAFRDVPVCSSNCLTSILQTCHILGTDSIEVILLDDHSDPNSGILEICKGFKSVSQTRVSIVHFSQNLGYSNMCAYGLSLSRGELALFVSHDMIVTADYIRTLVQTAALEPRFGVLRGTSPYIDGMPQHVCTSPFETRTPEDIFAFSAYMARYWGLAVDEDQLLIGDSFLVRREVLDKVGVFDPRYGNFFGDLDFGLRVQRAGYRLGCAKGAWLHHDGEAHFRQQQGRSAEPERIKAARALNVQKDYARFRQKWNAALSPVYPGVQEIPFAWLVQQPASGLNQYQQPLVLSKEVCELF